jgi:hypothetical protein
MTAPRAQIESWIREQIDKDGSPRNDAEVDRLTQRALLAHKEEFQESPILQRFVVRFALEAIAERLFNGKPPEEP